MPRKPNFKITKGHCFFNFLPFISNSSYKKNLLFPTILLTLLTGLHQGIILSLSKHLLMLKVNKRNTKKSCEICSKLAIFIVNYEQINTFF